MGSKEGLRAVVDKLPFLLRQSLVARKTIETALLNFGPAAVPVLIDEHGESADPLVASCVLNTLSHFSPDTRAVFLAIERLSDADPEVRSRALRVLARAEKNLPAHLPTLVLPLLSDPVWFVRLQAVKAAGALPSEQAATAMGKLLFDPNWQVRSGAALALAELGDSAVDVFLDALTHYDAHARESVCEELDRTGFTGRLIANLTSPEAAVREKSRQILTIMRTAGFTARIAEYLRTAADDRTRSALRELLAEGPRR
jgi:HEAT repeat protein